MPVVGEWYHVEVEGYPPVDDVVLVSLRYGCFDIAQWTGEFWRPVCACVSYESSMDSDVIWWARVALPHIEESEHASRQ